MRILATMKCLLRIESVLTSLMLRVMGAGFPVVENRPVTGIAPGSSILAYALSNEQELN